eukprot:1144561-Pelagomonas_calceolata.AAC.1
MMMKKKSFVPLDCDDAVKKEPNYRTVKLAGTDLTGLRTQYQILSNSAPLSSASHLQDFMSQAAVLGLAETTVKYLNDMLVSNSETLRQVLQADLHLADMEDATASSELSICLSVPSSAKRTAFFFVSELMDLFLAGRDQPQADQPNDLAE